MSTVYEIKIPGDRLVELSKDIPEIKTALNSIYGIDAGISYGRAVETFAETMKRLNERTALGKMNRQKSEMLDKIKNVIFNNPATIVFWADGTKTVVKCEHEDFDPEKGLAMAIVKKVMADNHSYYNEIFKKWLPKERDTIEAIYPGEEEAEEITYQNSVPASKKADLPKGRKNV